MRTEAQLADRPDVVVHSVTDPFQRVPGPDLSTLGSEIPCSNLMALRLASYVTQVADLFNWRRASYRVERHLPEGLQSKWNIHLGSSTGP